MLIFVKGLHTQVEPYPKSKVEELYKESCSFWDEDYSEKGKPRKIALHKLRIEPFIGIGPRKYLDFFAMRTISGRRIERKVSKTGKAVSDATHTLLNPKGPASPFGVKEREEVALEQLVSVFDRDSGMMFSVAETLVGKILSDTLVKINSTWTKSLDERILTIIEASETPETAAEVAAKSKNPSKRGPGRPPKPKDAAQERVKADTARGKI